MDGRRWIGLALLAATATACGMFDAIGSGRRLDDRTTPPRLPGSVLEKVVDLDYPPGNIAVSRGGRVFFTLHPDGHPPAAVMELVDGKPVPYAPPGTPAYDTVLSMRIDAQDRLWVMDHAGYARGTPRLLAFDLATNTLAHQYDFPSSSTPLLAMLNDFQIDPEGRAIYIAEASPIRQRPAIIVYDPVARTSRRVLERHPSVMPRDFVIQAPGRDMIVYGFYRLTIGIDSIAIDHRGEWLYYGAVNSDRLYRVPTAALRDVSLSAEALAAKVEDFAPKSISDGLSSDETDTIYVTDPEHSAVGTIGQDRQLRTLVRDDRLRWPDGLSFGPDGWLYVTCSSLHHVLFIGEDHMRANAPYQIFRFKPGTNGTPGH